jgi:RNA polymerase sigma-70 factor (ECF subfamily)
MKLGWKNFDVSRHLVAMRRYAQSLTRHAQDGEDLVHSALLRAYERRETYRPDENLRTWLFAILHNIFIDNWRRAAAEQARIAALSVGAPTHAEPAQYHALHLGQIYQAYLDLPDELRAAFHLVALEGLSYQQAADVLGVPIGTVMSRISRSRDILRRHGEAAAPSRATLRVVGGTHEPSA